MRTQERESADIITGAAGMRIITKRAVAILLAMIAISPAAAIPQTISPAQVFERSTTTPTLGGTAQPVNVSIESWALTGKRDENGTAQEIPLRGFYVAHLISGHISASIDGQTMKHLPGDYWTVEAGKTLQVKVLGELAVLETIAVAKP